MKKIEGYDYSICPTGRVYSHKSNKFLKGQTNGRKQYRIVCLYDNCGNRAYPLIHRLVAQYYIPNPDNLPCVNHLDGDKDNNHVSNLEWCSYSDNNTHSFESKLKYSVRYCDTEKIYQAIRYKIDGWRNCDIAEALGLDLVNMKYFLYHENFQEIRDECGWENRVKKSESLNDDLVVKICELLEKGQLPSQIESVLGVPARKISNIRNRQSFVLISQSFNF